MSSVVQLVNVGTQVNDGLGDPLRTAFIKVNESLTTLCGLAQTGTNLTIGSAGGGDSTSVVVGKSGSILQVKGLIPGANVTFTDYGTSVLVDAIGGSSGEVNTASNIGSGEGVFAAKSGVDLRFKSVASGSNINVYSNGSEVFIESTATGGITGGENIGGQTYELFAGTSGGNLQFKTVAAGDNVTIDQTGSTLAISVDIPESGEVVAAGTNVTVDKANGTSTVNVNGTLTDIDKVVYNQQLVTPTNGTLTVDFSTLDIHKADFNGDIHVRSAGEAPGKFAILRLHNSGDSNALFSVPTEWEVVGPTPEFIPAGSAAYVSLNSMGSTNSQVVAAIAVEDAGFALIAADGGVNTASFGTSFNVPGQFTMKGLVALGNVSILDTGTTLEFSASDTGDIVAAGSNVAVERVGGIATVSVNDILKTSVNYRGPDVESIGIEPYTGTLPVDFAGSANYYNKVNITGNVHFTPVNYVPGRAVAWRLTGDGSPRSVTVQAEVTAYGTLVTEVPANRSVIYEFDSWGSSVSDVAVKSFEQRA